MCIKTVGINDVSKYNIGDNMNRVLIDLRNEDEYNSGHIRGAINIPYKEFDNEKLLVSRYRYIMLYCESGSMSIKLARRLSKEGFIVINLYGGITAYKGELVKTDKQL